MQILFVNNEPQIHRKSGVRKATVPIQSLVKLQPWFLSLRWKTCLRQNCILDSGACSEGPALGQNTLIMMIMIFLCIIIL